MVANSVAVMQPYFYPYVGYFHLIKSVETFVSFDDVNFIKKGWINRNQILSNGASIFFNLPIREMSQNKKINESYIHEPETSKKKVLELIQNSYRKAPFFSESIEKIEELIMIPDENIAVYNTKNLAGFSNYLGLSTKFLLSSEIPHHNELRGQEKILDLLKHLQAKTYVNAIGGQDLYQQREFNQVGIELRFIQSKKVQYTQFSNEFIPYLSILDALMFCGIDRLKSFIDDFDLIAASA